MDRKEYNRQYYLKHREKLKKRHYQHYQEHREAYKEKALQWYHEHKVVKPKKKAKTNSERCREYYLRNKDTINKRMATYHRERRERDPLFKMKHNIRNLIRSSMNRYGNGKSIKTAEIVGCDIDFLCNYLFNTWEQNYTTKWNGEPYHIDHIIPLATAKTESDVIRLCHYTNLQMLKPDENMKKGNKMY